MTMHKAKLTREAWNALRYPIEVRALSEAEGGGWLAHIPLLGKGLFMAHGETAAEAIERLEAQRRDLYDTVVASGAPIPLPTEDEEPPASGKWLQRASPSLHAELRRAAEQEGVSFNSLCEGLLIKALYLRSAEDAFGRMAEGILDDMRFRIAREARAARYLFAGLETESRIALTEDYDFESFQFEEAVA